MNAVKNPNARRLFPTGRLVATPAVLDEVPKPELLAAFQRHMRGDWGEVSEADWAANDCAVQNGDRLLSAYKSNAGVKFWVITEADRSYTTILLPSDY